MLQTTNVRFEFLQMRFISKFCLHCSFLAKVVYLASKWFAFAL